MATKQKVTGQTGRVVLSDDAIHYKLGKKRTVRYQYSRLSDKRWMAWVNGPFHSRTYGACGMGATKQSAKASLQTNLANNYRYLGHLLFSDVDSADHVGEIDTRLLDSNVVNHSITR